MENHLKIINGSCIDLRGRKDKEGKEWQGEIRRM
jgi:hypothetical protein